MKNSHTQLQVSQILSQILTIQIGLSGQPGQTEKNLNILEKKLRAKLGKVIIYRV